MSLKIGIVGLPNVGKSTLFNALTRSKSAEAANYPFCTIDPNVGVVEVPDERIDQLIKIVNPAKTIPAVIEFVDIAGLVKGASEGEGLGNKFLSNIRECDAIAQVIRVFEDPDVVHVHGEIEPQKDREIIEAELIFADLQTLDKRMKKAEGEAKSGDKFKRAYVDLLKRIELHLHQGKLLSHMDFTKEEKAEFYDLHFLTMKPLLYIANVHENEVGNIDVETLRKKLDISGNSELVPISARVEEELGSFSDSEAAEYLETLGMKETGLNQLIKASYRLLDLITYFTAGVTEVHAWTIHRGWTAPKAAGVIHTDFEKGFIRAEVISCEDFIANNGEIGAKDKGLMRLEGKEYVVNDGDVMHFRFSK
ncbi:redox-regulated ATPase YchF [Patescibacteria group bacterium]|nr:redox-regulated ATPase YchF [Patescibacteria group bacterium]